MDATTITISGMSCAHCVAAVEQALVALPGVTVEQVEIGSARVRIDPEVSSQAVVETAIDAAGYDVVTGRTLNVTTPHQA